MEQGKPAEEPEKLDPVEVFQVIGASDSVDPEELKSKAEEVGASPEVVEFMEKLPEETSEPADVVQAAITPENNDVNAEMDFSNTAQDMEQLTVDDVVTGGEGSAN